MGSEEEEPRAGRRQSRPGFLPVGPGFRSMDRGRRVAARSQLSETPVEQEQLGVLTFILQRTTCLKVSAGKL